MGTSRLLRTVLTLATAATVSLGGVEAAEAAPPPARPAVVATPGVPDPVRAAEPASADPASAEPVPAKAEPAPERPAALSAADEAPEPAAGLAALGPCDGTIDAGETISCSSPGGTDVRDLTFAATSGDRFLVRVIVTSGAVNPLTSVLRGAATVCAQTFADQFTCAITVSGTHTLRIAASGSAAGVYTTTIERLNDPSACPAVTLGPTGVASSLATVGEVDCRAATGAVGQRWRVRLVETSGSATLVHEVVRADGSTVCGATSAVESTCLLDAAGPHRVIVTDSSGLQTGGYRLMVQKFPSPAGCAALALGTPQTASLDDPGELVCRRITGLAAGDRLRLRSIFLSGGVNPLTEVLRPDGTTACALTFADELTCVADVAGTYTVLVRDGAGNGASTGDVRLVAEQLDDPSSCPAVTLGATGVASTLGAVGEIDCRQATGAVGQRWRVRLVETSGSATLVHEVVRPDGSTVCGATSAVESTCLLDAAGPHRVIVTDSSGLQTGGYRLVVQKFPSPAPATCPTLALGAPETATLDDPGEFVCRRVTGLGAGDRLRLRSIFLSRGVNPLTEVVRPDGTTACALTFADELTCVADVAGTYTVLVRDGAGNGASTGEVRLVAEQLDDPSSCPAVALNATGVASTISAVGEIDCREATGAAGQRWRIRLIETSGSATLLHEVVRPDGSTVCGATSSVESTCVLDAAGKNRVIVTDSSGLQTGGYRLVVEKFPAPAGCAVLALGTPQTASLDDPGELVCRRITGVAAGDRLRLRSIFLSGGVNPLTEILRPDGTTACAVTFADEITCVADVAGVYTVLVRDGAGNGAATGDVRLVAEQLDDPSSCPAVALNPTGVASTLAAVGEIDCREATGAAGQRWRVRLVETSGSATLLHEVVRPDGSTVCGTTSSVESTCLLDAAGKNRVIVTDSSGLQTGGYRLVVEKFPAPTGCAAMTLGTPETASLDDAGELVCRRITGVAAGDRLRLRSIFLSGTVNPLTEVLRPDGTTACAVTFADEITCVADVAGVYTVLIRDGAGNGAGTGDVRLVAEQLDDPSTCPAVTVGPTGVASSLGAVGEIDCREATGAAGERWRIRLVETSGSATLVHEVVRPDGSTLCGATSGVESTCLLDAAGPHRVVVTDSSGLQTGGYRLVVQRFPTPVGCPAVTLGAPATTGTIDDQGELGCYRFGGSTGDQVRVRVADVVGGTANVLTEVLRPDGTTVCSNTFSEDFTCTLTSGGQHVVVVRDGTGVGAGTGSHTVRLDLL